ncbi:carbonic anhydrase [Neisseria perflava]|uniref:carbonic anhydrase n=1 Tax=Neisseria perflava TaxID=33053 RepID=UPI0020A03105|nr:carbonic anhydrase [Neisseria perflava]MCP1660950.1 carbonic anhydrase [Neisseria perflava]MCP1773220.1 carbonic anhydrase [Neisseria perflava]
MLRHTLLAAACALSLTTAAFAEEGHTHWGYTGHESPESWGSLSPEFQTCGQGKNQSPVNITTTDTVSARLPRLKFHYQPAAVKLTDNGHSIQADYSDGSNTLEVGGHTYTLKQFHFHVPSENVIKSQSFPMELHLVHADAQGNTLVLAVLYEQGKENTRLNALWQNLPEQAGQSVALPQAFNAATLLPKRHGYYRFEGSLTTPPCSEGVTWIVLKHYDSVSPAQAQRFEKIIGTPNNRPVQPLNARIIVK